MSKAEKIQRVHYAMTLLGDGLQGLGLSMAVHNEHEEGGITETHAAQLGFLVEALGLFAAELAEQLEEAK